MLTANVSQLYIDWVSTDVFTMGYIDSSAVSHVSEIDNMIAGAITIGTEIGFYGDLRLAGQSVGVFILAVAPIPTPEPSTLALCGMGLAPGLFAVVRRKKSR